MHKGRRYRMGNVTIKILQKERAEGTKWDCTTNVHLPSAFRASLEPYTTVGSVQLLNITWFTTLSFIMILSGLEHLRCHLNSKCQDSQRSSKSCEVINCSLSRSFEEQDPRQHGANGKGGCSAPSRRLSPGRHNLLLRKAKMWAVPVHLRERAVEHAPPHAKLAF